MLECFEGLDSKVQAKILIESNCTRPYPEQLAELETVYSEIDGKNYWK